MPTTATSPPIVCTRDALSTLATDLVAVPWFEDEDAAAVAGLDAATGGDIARAIASREFQAKLFEPYVTSIVDPGWKARRVMLMGAGKRTEAGADVIRKVAAASGLIARQKRMGRVAFVLRGPGEVAALAQASAEGLTLAEFHAGSYKTGEPVPAAPAWTIALVEDAPDALARVNPAVARGRVLGECSNLARELANEPGNTLTPREFAARCERIVTDAGVSCDIFDE